LYTLGHLSDWHATSLAAAEASALTNKRFFGWLSWRVKRRHLYRAEVLEAVIDDLSAQAPDHMVVTGDLTNVALEQEFVETRQWLEKLGGPDKVSVIPGNHDAYIATPPNRSWDYWAPYMLGDRGEQDAVESNGPHACSGGDRAPVFDEYPVQWSRGDLAIVGVCSAVPTPLFQASGRVGASQLQRLEALLTQLGKQGRCRVVLIHHPPVDRGMSARRRLSDSRAFRDVLSRAGAELVLHGHRHRTAAYAIAGPNGTPIPIIGVRSAAYAGPNPEKSGQYHLYRIEKTGDAKAPYSVRIKARGFDRDSGQMKAMGEIALAATP
jgi:3',5'-cyclic AMP phosphodiesterase CpdA